MRTVKRVFCGVLLIGGCGGSATLLQSVDGGTGVDGGANEASVDGGCSGLAPACFGSDDTQCCGWDPAGPATCQAGQWMCGSAAAPGCNGTKCVAPADGGEDASCYTDPVWPFNLGKPEPLWATGICPDAGCPIGTTCVLGEGELTNVFGCAPIATECAGTPSCACMGCICGQGGCWVDPSLQGALTCPNGTISRRVFKADITYVDDKEREALAHQALEIPLARYRYKNEPQGARRRLGFVIDDQPDPSPAVQADRTHVDEYGYTSMLLATVQQQAKELAELRRRLEALEAERSSSAKRAPAR